MDGVGGESVWERRERVRRRTTGDGGARKKMSSVRE
jgi:hypothetical protein